MKKYIKGILTIAFIFVMAITLTGCNDKENSGEKTIGEGKNNKTYTFPTASFIPSGVEYTGSGKIEYSSRNEEITPKYADAYVSNAKIEDVVSYVETLKSKGLHNANSYKEEQTGFDEYGSFSWVGTNDSEDFSISVTITEESTPLNLVDASYNLAIVMSNENPYAE